MYHIKIYDSNGDLIRSQEKCFSELPEISQEHSLFGLSYDCGSLTLYLLYDPNSSTDWNVFITDTLSDWDLVEIWWNEEKLFAGFVDRDADIEVSDNQIQIPFIGDLARKGTKDIEYSIEADQFKNLANILSEVNDLSSIQLNCNILNSELSGIATYLSDNYPSGKYHTGISFSSSGGLLDCLKQLGYLAGGRFLIINNSISFIDVKLAETPSLIVPDGSLVQDGFAIRNSENLTVDIDNKLVIVEKDNIASVKAEFQLWDIPGTSGASPLYGGEIFADVNTNQWKVIEVGEYHDQLRQDVILERYPSPQPTNNYYWPANDELTGEGTWGAVQTVGFYTTSTGYGYQNERQERNVDFVKNYLKSNEIGVVSFNERYLSGVNSNINEGAWFSWKGKVMFASEVIRNKATNVVEITGVEI